MPKSNSPMNSKIKTRYFAQKSGTSMWLTRCMRAVLIGYAGINLAWAQNAVLAPASDPIDKLKNIPLNESSGSFLTVGGQIRDRYEDFQNYQFGSGPQDSNGYNLLRVLLNADLHLGQHARVFVEGISATEQGRNGGPRSSDVNRFDLFQGFVDFTYPINANSSVTFRGGRQVIIFGAQRLIGVSDFTNVRRTFDGVKGTWTTPANTLDVFYARPVQVLPYRPDKDVPGTSIAGIYDTWQLPGALEKAKTQWEIYALRTVRRTITFNQTTSGETRDTFGTRLSASPKPFDYDLEADYQAGKFNGQTTHAFSAAAIGGYTLENMLFAPRAFLGSDIASGGSRTNPGDTFDQLFPSGHDKFGIIDAIGWQNIIDVHPGLKLILLKNKPWLKQLTLLGQYRRFWRQNDQGAVYTSSGSILRNSGASRARDIGGEVDMEVNCQFDSRISAYAGYCHFSPGGFITATGPANDIHFGYSALTFTF